MGSLAVVALVTGDHTRNASVEAGAAAAAPATRLVAFRVGGATAAATAEAEAEAEAARELSSLELASGAIGR